MTSASAASANLRARLRGQRAPRSTSPKFFPSLVHELPFAEMRETYERIRIDRVVHGPALPATRCQQAGLDGIEPLSFGHPEAAGTILVQEVENQRECIEISCVFVTQFEQPPGATVAPK